MYTKPEHDRLLQEADDMVFAMRMLAASEDIDQAAHIIRDALDLQMRAVEYDRANPDDDFVLGYVQSQMKLVADNIRGLPSNNRSATADEARKYRMRVGSDVYFASRDRDAA